MIYNTNIWHLFAFSFPLLAIIIIIGFNRLYDWKRLLVSVMRAIAQLTAFAMAVYLVFIYYELIYVWSVVALLLSMVMLASAQCAWTFWRQEIDQAVLSLNYRIGFWRHFHQANWALFLPSILVWLGWLSIYLTRPLEITQGQALISVGFGGLAIHGSFLGAFIAGKHFTAMATREKKKIESALALGLGMRQAFHWLLREAMAKIFDPLYQVVAMVGFGQIPAFMAAALVFQLPILDALGIQIIVLFGFLICVALAALLTVSLQFRAMSRNYLPERMLADKNFGKKKKIRIK